MVLALKSGLSLHISVFVSHSFWLTSSKFCKFILLFCSTSVIEESFGYLDAPVERIAGADVPMPYAANLERLAVPQVVFLNYYFSFL